MKTPQKCLECGLSNWSTDEFCKRCNAALNTTPTDLAIPKPLDTPENSFADLYSPDYGMEVFPSHSQTPQMVARMATQRNAAQFQQSKSATTADVPIQNIPRQEANSFVRREQKQKFETVQPVAVRSAVNLKSGIAIASMILGIFGFLTAFILVGFVFALVGLILGIVALLKISKNPRIYGGKPFAITGIVVSSLAMLLLLIIAAIAIPNLLAARRSANEASAISSIRVLASAQSVFMQTKEISRCGELANLETEGLVDAVLAKGEKNGYRFLVVNSPFGGCEITAKPISSSTGTRDFYFSTEDNLLRVGDRNGQPLN